MKKLMALWLTVVLFLSSAVTALAAGGTVTYSENAGEFVFAPGSEQSLTDLFPNFKDVMPGDTLTQTITVKNKADNRVKVKIYMRSLGAHEESSAFLSQLGLRVQKSEENDMAYMFDAAADETAQLTDWVCLGTLYSGGEVNLDVTLDVPTELDNTFQKQIGYLDWEFMVEEYPVEDSDPKPPQTGENSRAWIWLTVLIASGVAGCIALVFRKRRKDV